MERRPIRLSNPNAILSPTGLRENESFLWMESNLLKYKVFGDDTVYDVSGFRIIDSANKVVLVPPTALFQIKGDFITRTSVQIEDNGTVSLDIQLAFDENTLISLLPTSTPGIAGLSYINSSPDADDMGTGSIAATPWTVAYTKQYIQQHVSNIRRIIAPVASASALPANQPVGTACIAMDTGVTYVYDNYLQAPRLIGTYSATGFDNTFTSKPVTTIALCNVDAKFLASATGNLSVQIQNNQFTVTKSNEPADAEELMVRYDIPGNMRQYIHWFTIVSGNAEGLVSGAFVFLQQWEESFIPSTFIQQSSGWRTL